MLFHDELHYAQQARDVAVGGLPRYNRAWQPKYPPLYGAALAPVRLLAGREGFRWWLQVANVAILLSALVPAYRVARMNLGRGPAVAAAALSLLLPFQILVTWLQSEILLIPLFLWLVYAALRVFGRATFGRSLLAGGVFGLMFLTKSLVVVVLPALVLAVVWSRRSILRSLVPVLGIVVGFAGVVAPWRFRAWWIPGEANVRTVYSYMGEFSQKGVQSFQDYLYWLRAEPGCALVALGTPVLTLGLAAMFSWLWDRDPRRRGLACFLLLSSVATSLLVSLWVAQVAYFAPKYQERYFLFLWPSFVLLFLFQIVRPDAGRRALALAVAVCGLLLVVMPDAFFDPASRYINLIEFPSSQQIFSLAALFDGPVGIRLVLAAPLLLLLGWPRRKVWAGAVLVILVVFYQGRGVLMAYQNTLESHREVDAMARPLLEWLNPHVAPGDTVIMHRIPNENDYRVAQHFEIDLNRVDDYLRPDWQSMLALDMNAGRYDVEGVPPTGRIYLLTTAPGGPAASTEWRFGSYRLIDFTGGFPSLGDWLSPPAPDAPVQNGVFEDQWCAPWVDVRLTVSYPGWHEVVFLVHLPVSGPIRESVHVAIRGPYGYHASRKLCPGDFQKLFWRGFVWTPVLHIVLEADRDSDYCGRRVSFQLAQCILDPWNKKSDREK